MERLTIKDIDLVQTCGACPEQYEAYHNEKQVGYLRLRHGCFRVDYPDVGGEQILYTEHVHGDGCFEDYEREFYLNEAKQAIVNRLALPIDGKEVEGE